MDPTRLSSPRPSSLFIDLNVRGIFSTAGGKGRSGRSLSIFPFSLAVEVDHLKDRVLCRCRKLIAAESPDNGGYLQQKQGP